MNNVGEPGLILDQGSECCDRSWPASSVIPSFRQRGFYSYSSFLIRFPVELNQEKVNPFRPINECSTSVTSLFRSIDSFMQLT